MVEVNPSRLVAVLVFALALTATLLVAGYAEKNGEAKWTVIVYMAADNDLEGAALVDLEEMEQVGSTSSVNIVVFIDRSPQGFEDRVSQRLGLDLRRYYGDWDDARIYYVVKGVEAGIQSRLVAELGEVNTGDPAVLVEVVKRAASLFPAEHYALIVWDHGAGLGYAAVDMSDRDALTLREIREALREITASGVHVDLLGFDACLMASFETAYEVSGYARVLVGSEETEPGDGWPYDRVLGYLVENPDASAEEWAKRIVEAYIDSYRGGPEEAYVTQSAILVDGLRENARRLFQEIVSVLEKDPGLAARARQGVQVYGDSGNGATNIDLIGFLRNLAGLGVGEAGTLLEELGKRVIAVGAGEEKRGSNGLSIYYPVRLDIEAYNAVTGFGLDTGWSRLLGKAVNIVPEVSEAPEATAQVGVSGYEEAASQAPAQGLLAGLGRVEADGDNGDELAIVLLAAPGDRLATSVVVVDYRGGELVKVIEKPVDMAPDEYTFQYPVLVVDRDVDGDGLSELLVLEEGMPLEGNGYARLVLVEFTGQGGVEARTAMASDFTPYSMAIGDVDGDGALEALLVGEKYGAVGVEGLSESYGRVYIVSLPGFSVENRIDFRPSSAGSATIPVAVAAGDVDGDGRDEVVLSLVTYSFNDYGEIGSVKGSVLVAEYTGEGLSPIAGAKYTAMDVAVGDVDADGGLEVVAGSADSCSFRVYRYTASANTLDPVMDVDLGLGCEAVAADISDLDGDGVYEVFAIGYWYDEEGIATSAVMKAYSLAGKPSLELVVEGLLAGNTSRIPLAIDFNGDGRDELVYVSQSEGVLRLSLHEITNYATPYGSLRGTVTENGAPVENAIVEVYVGRQGEPKTYVTTTNSNGEFTLQRLPAATYQVDVVVQGRVAATGVAVVEAGKESNIRLEIAAPQENIETTTTTTTAATTQLGESTETTATTTTSPLATTATETSPTTTLPATTATTATTAQPQTGSQPPSSAQGVATSQTGYTTAMPTGSTGPASQSTSPEAHVAPATPTKPSQEAPLPLIGAGVAAALAVIVVIAYLRRRGGEAPPPPPPPA